MFSRLRKLPPAVAALLAVLALSACGDSHTRVTTGTYAGEAGKAAPYLYVGPLQYQVQISRELNPANPEDAAYLVGLTPAQRKLEPGEEWFAVFIQVYNTSDQDHVDANEFTVTDTEHNTYTPLTLGEANEYAYRQGTVPAHNQIPLPGTVADNSGPQGALLLYKIQIASLDNRPLEIKIFDPSDLTQTASAVLDV